jgi:hypothetical protein
MKKTNITLSIALAAVFSASTAFAEVELTGKIVHESAVFSGSGSVIGKSRDNVYQGARKHDSGDLFKAATQAKIFIDGETEINGGSAYHVELNAFNDQGAVNDNRDNDSYTQRDFLREAYLDTEVGDVSIRAGKQQVVWGTADGMKLLDAINPTDYTEMAQNQMEDSRMPIWMINAESDSTYGDGGSFQMILSEARGNKIAGLGEVSSKGTTHTNQDTGSAFMMKGVETLVGKNNGFLNIAPALGKVAYSFSNDAGGHGTANGLGQAYPYTVEGFTNNNAGNFRFFCVGGVADADCLSGIANGTGNPEDPTVNSFAANTGGQNNHQQNLIDAADGVGTWDTQNPNSMFEYMAQTTFASFDRFVSLTSEYRVEEISSEANLGFKYKNVTANGVNYSLNFMNHIDSNPYVQMHYEKQDGTRLYEKAGTGNYVKTVELCATDATCSTSLVGGDAGVTNGTGTSVQDTNYAANLVFVEKHARINSLGGSLDTAIETAALGPVVLRGEFLYDSGVMTPVITRRSTDSVDLEHGFFVNAFTPTKTDYLKYVLGADITVMTNMMLSGQVIMIHNLDYVDEYGTDNWKYTADTAAMSLSNNFKKAKEAQGFVSLFASKPFGASGEHRWNNILMFEDNGNGAFWNRLDAEFSINDETQATVEWNKYFGDEDTQFGQLANTSNVQVGFKYSF